MFRKAQNLLNCGVKTPEELKASADLQTPASVWQLDGEQVPHHLLLPGFSQWDLGHMARD